MKRREEKLMIATSRVKNSAGKTVGFIVDGGYYGYYSILGNIDLIDNLTVTANGVIKTRGKALDSVKVSDVNFLRYTKLCKDNQLSRDIQYELNEWKNRWNDYVMYLTGARQIGKTTEILKFAYSHYEQIIYINLAKESSLKEFEKAVSSGSVVLGIARYCINEGLEPFVNSSSTAVIIDEIQESCTVYNSIRALQGELECHIIVTGSYLGKVLNSRYFKPAGNLKEIEMMPLSFREFCRAFNRSNILDSISLYGKSNGKDYEILEKLYSVYTKIGGYPAVVREYVRSKSISRCYEVIKTIIDRFTEESASYFNNNKCYIVFDNVYKAALISITKEKKGTSSKDIKDITNFIKEDTNEHVSRGEVNSAVSWLKYSKILGGCDLYNQGNVMDLLSERRMYFMDCGIASYVAQLTAIDKETIKGMIAETFVYNELYRLYKTGVLKGDKPCCSVVGDFELDFMLVDKNDVKYGIEVKATSSTHTKSISYCIDRGVIDRAYLAEITHGDENKTVKRIPIYTVGCRFPYSSK